MPFREAAVAAYTTAQAAARTALIDKAKATLLPVITDPVTVKPIIDPKLITAPHVDMANGLVVLKMDDPTHFAVQGETVRLTTGSGTDWTAGDVVKTLHDVGKALA